MALYILVYLISLLDKLQALTGTALVLSGVGLLLILMYISIETDWQPDDLPPFLKRVSKVATAVFVCSFLVTTFLPSKQTAYVLAGLYVGEKVVTNERLNKYMDKALQIVDKELDKKLEELGAKDEVQN